MQVNIFCLHPDVTEVMFAPDSQSSDNSKREDRLSVAEYVAITVSSVLLGLIYVASVFLYLHMRRRSRQGTKGDAVENCSTVAGGEGVVKSNPLLSVPSHHFTSETLYGESSSDTDRDRPDIVQHRVSP